MYLNPIHNDIPWDSFEPDTVVYSPYGSWDLAPELGDGYADCAYTSETECKGHFWFHTDGFNATVKKESVRDFLRRRMSDAEMNPFCTLGKMKVLSEHRNLWEKE